MHKSELSPIWFSPSGEVEQFRGKRVSAELRMGRRWHFMSTGTIRVNGPDERGRVAIDLVMTTPFPRSGHEHEVIPLQQSELLRLVASSRPDCDYRYEGVLYRDIDPHEDSCGPDRPPKIVTPDDAD